MNNIKNSKNDVNLYTDQRLNIIRINLVKLHYSFILQLLKVINWLNEVKGNSAGEVIGEKIGY